MLLKINKLECWSYGVLEKSMRYNILFQENTPTHYSNTPLFQTVIVVYSC